MVQVLRYRVVLIIVAQKKDTTRKYSGQTGE